MHTDKDARAICKGHHRPHGDVETRIIKLRPPNPVLTGYICPSAASSAGQRRKRQDFVHGDGLVNVVPRV